MTAVEWQKSSFSNEQDNCVELAAGDGHVKMRESDDPGVVVAAGGVRLRALIAVIKAGRFDQFLDT